MRDAGVTLNDSTVRVNHQAHLLQPAGQGAVATGLTPLSCDQPMKTCSTRIAILHPSDPLGNVPSGIDSFIRGILRWAPADLEYTLIGASSDPVARPLNVTSEIMLAGRTARFLPLVTLDARARRSFYPLTARYLRALTPLIARRRLDEYDILDFHRIEPGLLLMKDARPKNLVMHQDMSVLRNQDSDIMWRHAPWLYERLERRVFSSLTRVFAVRESAVERYKTMYPPVASRFSFIPTWVDDTIFRPAMANTGEDPERRETRQTLGIEPDAPVMIFVGRLDRQKDPMLLIAAFVEAKRRCPNLHLLIVGDGILRGDVSAACARAGVERDVQLLGVRPPAEIARLARASDLFVLSSAYEGMPIAVLEALACGIPVVSTDVGEIRRVVTNGVNGIVSTERAPQALAAAITTTIEAGGAMRGDVCIRAIAAFRPENVLGRIYENHRAQSTLVASHARVCHG